MMKHFTSLQNHQFEEERARMILALYDPYRFEDSVLSESPDIVNNRLGIGVEVTDCTKANIREGSSWASSISGKSIHELNKADRDHIAARRVSVTLLPVGKFIAGFSCWGDNYDVKDAFQRKLIKLNQPHFAKFAENDLLLLCWMIDSEELESSINFFLNDIDYQNLSMNDNPLLKFDRVYICKEELLVEINLHDKSCVRFNIISESNWEDPRRVLCC